MTPTREPTPQTDENVSPRTEAGRRLSRLIGYYELNDDFLRSTILAIEAEAAAPGLDVERLADDDLVMLKATIVKEEQRRYAVQHPDSDEDAR